MGNTQNTIANWERASKQPSMGDQLIRIFCQAHQNGDQSVKDVVASLNSWDWLKNRKLILEARRGRRCLAREVWAARLQT